MSKEAVAPKKYRSLEGPARWVEAGFLSSITIFGCIWATDLLSYLGITIYRQQYLGLFWGLILASVFLLVPANITCPRNRVPWYDWILVLLSLIIGFYVLVLYPRLLFVLAVSTPDKYLLGACSLLMLIEATRRLLGKALLFILLLFIVYGATAEYLPGLLNGSGVSLKRMVIYLFLDTNALLGLPLVVASSVVLPFVLLGQALFATGGGAFFTDLAMALMGKFRGGPAKVAVFASTLFGTISGTAVSNVVTTGIITIPLMKRNGYRPEVAGAVEAVASTGGQIMPPVMGSAAFLIAEFLEMPYGEVVLAALVPALLYYFVLFVQVDLEAVKHNIAGLPEKMLPKKWEVIRKGWQFLLPLIVLIYGLFYLNFPPGKAGMVAVGALVVVSLFSRAARPGKKEVVGILTSTGRGLLDLGIITGIAGMIIGVLNLSGLGFSVSLSLVHLGGNSLLLLLVLAALLSMLLGMGMPTVSVYILLAMLVAPALEKLGLTPIAAHLFILYFGLLSMITPPVAIASYAAAAISGSEPLRTGWESVKLGAMAYIVPFIFVYSPALLLKGSLFNILWTVLSTVLGAVLLGIALRGYLYRKVSGLLRIFMIACACGLFLDHRYLGGSGAWLNIAGAAAGLITIGFERVGSRKGL
ncbi:MAG: TRAP transporter fused permease subunit [Pseudomonadota bacterium]